jgi:MerR family transcriptional regulator, copper efflux regulator
MARLAGVPARTLRYYVDRGLIKPTRRSPSGYRLFDENSLRRLRFVRRMQGLGLTLRELQQLLQAAERQSCGDSSAIMQRRLAGQLATVERRIDELHQIRHELSSLLARHGGGCADELCLCNRPQLVEVETQYSGSAARPD